MTLLQQGGNSTVLGTSPGNIYVWLSLNSRLKIFSHLRTPLLAFLMLAVLGTANSAQLPNKKISILPAILLLLEDSAINLQVGQANTSGFSNSTYPTGVDFSVKVNSQELELHVSVDLILEGQTITVLYDGNIVGELSNGQGTILLAASESNIADLRFEAEEGQPWRINSILLLLTEGPKSRAEAQRFLTKATFGATNQSIKSLMAIGYEAWIDRQFSLSPTLN